MHPTKIMPGPGQESVWDYPRPPRLEATTRHLLIRFADEVLAQTLRGFRVLETSHPPVYYFPLEDIRREFLLPSTRSSFCEWKGEAQYWSVSVHGKILRDVAWFYPRPTPAFLPIKNYVAFYAGPMDGCFVDGEKVTPQPGGFYGGWITSDLVGPFKGGPGSMGW
ncbi:MAG: DUF427 domain-containing protein [Gemmataceae bacterium]